MFPSFFKLTRIGCRIFRLIEASISRSSLSVVVTYEHTYSALSSTYPQLTGGDGELGGPDRSSLSSRGPTTPKDSGAWTTSPETVHLSVQRPVPCITMSWSVLSISSLGQGSTPSAMTSTTPRGAPSAASSAQACASYEKGGTTPILCRHCRPILQPAISAPPTPALLTPPAPVFPGALPPAAKSLRGHGGVIRDRSRWRRQGQVRGCHWACSRLTDDRSYQVMIHATQKSSFEFKDRNRRSGSCAKNRQLHAHRRKHL
jgi:hypothetical protein